MQVFVAIFWGSLLLFVIGIGFFAHFWRTRQRWAWEVSICFLALGIFGLTWLW